MDVAHNWHDIWRSKISLNSTLPTPRNATDFALHPPFQLFQASYAVWWQFLLQKGTTLWLPGCFHGMFIFFQELMICIGLSGFTGRLFQGLGIFKVRSTGTLSFARNTVALISVFNCLFNWKKIIKNEHKSWLSLRIQNLKSYIHTKEFCGMQCLACQRSVNNRTSPENLTKV